MAQHVSIGPGGIVHVDGRPLLFGAFGKPGEPVTFEFNAPSPAAAMPMVGALVEQFRQVAQEDYRRLAADPPRVLPASSVPPPRNGG